MQPARVQLSLSLVYLIRYLGYWVDSLYGAIRDRTLSQTGLERPDSGALMNWLF